MSLDDLQIFYHVAHWGSLSQAAKVLNTNISSISRRIKNLEDSSGTKLMIRHSRGISLTDAGQRVFTHAKIVCHEAQKFSTTVADLNERSDKRLRLSAPADFINTWVIQNLHVIQNKEKGVVVEITANSDLDELEAPLPDIELSFESTARLDFIEKPVGSFNFHLFCSDVYHRDNKLHRSHKDLPTRDFIAFTDHSPFFYLNGLMPIPKNTLGHLRVSSLTEMITAISNGNGIGFLPSWVDDPRLKRVVFNQISTQPQSIALFLSYPMHLRGSPKIEISKKQITDQLRTQPLAINGAKKREIKNDAIVICSLFSQTGLMAPWESNLSLLSKRIVEKFNRDGGVLGKKIKLLTPDPKSNWSEYGNITQKLIDQKITRHFVGCWTSAARKQVIPAISNQNGTLFYPLHFEGDEVAKEVVYLNAPPTKSVIPALEYALSKAGDIDSFIGIGSDYVWPRTINEISSSYLKAYGVPGSKVTYRYYPVGFTDLEDEIDAFAKLSERGKNSIILSVSLVGPSLKEFLKLLSKADIDLSRFQIIAFDATDLDTYLLDCSKIEGLLACWGYFEQSTQNPAHDEFKTICSKDKWLATIPIIDPAVSTYNAFQFWRNAVQRAQSLDHGDVTAALAETRISCPSTGAQLGLNKSNNILNRQSFLGALQKDGRFAKI